MARHFRGGSAPLGRPKCRRYPASATRCGNLMAARRTIVVIGSYLSRFEGKRWGFNSVHLLRGVRRAFIRALRVEYFSDGGKQGRAVWLGDGALKASFSRLHV